MSLFSTVLHIYKRSPIDTVNELKKELQASRGFRNFSKLDITNSTYQDVIDNEVYSERGIFYLITPTHGNWNTIIDLNVNVENPLYLYDLTNSLSKRLNTYYQYFFTAPVDKEEVLAQRHTPEFFSNILPATNNIVILNEILNEGYWSAFDNGNLDEDGVPSDDKYIIDEQDRFERIGKYLEIFSKDDYPFADWHSNLAKLNLDSCYLLKANK